LFGGDDAFGFQAGVTMTTSGRISTTRAFENGTVAHLLLFDALFE